MNTATSIREMDAETIAHELIASCKAGKVMRAVLNHYGLELHADDTNQFVQRAVAGEPVCCPQCFHVFPLPPKTCEMGDACQDPDCDEHGPHIHIAVTTLDDDGPRSIAVPVCDECGTLNEFHSGVCSKGQAS